MAYLEWKDSLSVNVPAIDAQHRKLLGLIDRLHEAMTQGEGHKVLGGIVGGLTEYTQVHFRDEEARFDASNYSDSIAHKR